MSVAAAALLTGCFATKPEPTPVPTPTPTPSPTPIPKRVWQDEDFESRVPVPYRFVPPGRSRALEESKTIIGEMREHVPIRGDTFHDVARFYGLGHNEMAAANPHIVDSERAEVNEWTPWRARSPLVIPQHWILPAGKSGTYDGVVINVPEMRLYYYRPAKRGEPRTVITLPVGLGRYDWQTPLGKFTIREKTRDPTWVIPESIQEERIADKGFSEEFIPGGSPENPLGKFRLRLSLPSYALHGTNKPWGVGKSVSHGCVRLYPEDIEQLFPMVDVGSKGEFIYETVKVGMQEGDVFVEVHDDLYGLQPGPWRVAKERIEKLGLARLVDAKKLLDAVQEKRGIPINVSLDPIDEPLPVERISPVEEDGPRESGIERARPIRSDEIAERLPERDGLDESRVPVGRRIPTDDRTPR